MYCSNDSKVVANKVIVNTMEGILFTFGKWRETFSNDNKFCCDDM